MVHFTTAELLLVVAEGPPVMANDGATGVADTSAERTEGPMLFMADTS